MSLEPQEKKHKIATGFDKWILQNSDQTIYYSLSCWNFTSVWFIRVTSSTGFVNAWSKILLWHWKQGVSDLQKQFSENFYNYYGSEASNEFQGCFTKSDTNRLLKCLYDALKLEFGGFKTYVNKQKIKV